jgi:hypothetical protein
MKPSTQSKVEKEEDWEISKEALKNWKQLFVQNKKIKMENMML